MKDRLLKRLKELREEYESATKVLADLEVREKDARITILTLRGAIGVIEEELKKDGDNDEAVKPAPKSAKPHAVPKPPKPQPVPLHESPAETGMDRDPEWYGASQSERKFPVAPGPDRNSEILKMLRKYAPPDRKYSHDAIDELFTGVYSHSEIDETLGVLELDGMIVRIKTGIKVM